MKTSEANEMYQKFLLKLGQAYSPEKIKGKDGLSRNFNVVNIVLTRI
jgi:hypothetical protein